MDSMVATGIDIVGFRASSLEVAVTIIIRLSELVLTVLLDLLEVVAILQHYVSYNYMVLYHLLFCKA
jgi:hypothetical protein